MTPSKGGRRECPLCGESYDSSLGHECLPSYLCVATACPGHRSKYQFCGKPDCAPASGEVKAEPTLEQCCRWLESQRAKYWVGRWTDQDTCDAILAHLRAAPSVAVTEAESARKVADMREQFALLAWSTGMDLVLSEHPSRYDAREVGAMIAKEIREAALLSAPSSKAQGATPRSGEEGV